jgi:hypothetical protein
MASLFVEANLDPPIPAANLIERLAEAVVWFTIAVRLLTTPAAAFLL